ncbi:dCMP deaminase [Amylostereum chailletii]|nr:dCMP deaminase [Amylostereum chailletii]
MLVAIIGTRGSGKSTIERYLVGKGFISTRITANNGERIADESDISFPIPSDSQTYGGNSQPPLSFNAASDMLAYVTQNWRANFVTEDLKTVEELGAFVIRPFLIVISIDAPVSTRFQRSARFVTLHIVNNYNSIAALHLYLDEINIFDIDRLRPSWDTYFMTLASLASMRSNCMKRRVGAILVRDRRIVATGYNGTPRGLINCNEGGCGRCNSGNEFTTETCLCLHAEENALLEAGRERIGEATLYCNTCPCLTCTIKIVQVGVREVVYNHSYKVDDASAKLFQEAGVLLRRHALPS